MKLLDEIIHSATGTKQDVSVLLRQCLVLSYLLKTERLKDWIDKELNGYSSDDELPEYRKVGSVALVFFVGPFGSSISDQPLNPLVLDEEHRHFATTATLTQPIAAYDIFRSRSQKKREFMIPWPPQLTTRYQTKFMKDYVLNRAHLKISEAVFVALIDTIRNRVLRFAVDLREELGLVSDDPAALPEGKVDQYVTNYIFGGTNVFAGAAHDFAQVGTIIVGKGDINGLVVVLRNLGVRESDVSELKSAIDDDAANRMGPHRG